VKIGAGVVGCRAGPIAHPIDARWLMAYAAGLGDAAPEYLDTGRPGGIVGHPLFPVCWEWPLALDLRARTTPEAIALRSVHATHDLRLHRRARPGDRLTTTATVIAAEARRPGTYLVSRFETVDADGRPVSTTDYGSIYRGVALEGVPPAPPPAGARAVVDAPREAGRADAPFHPDWSERIPISPALAHVYTECARIWNPIHTDRAVALAAGLPGIILHGTATLALAVSAILRHEPAGALAPVAGIRCRFGGMVALPGAIEVLARRSPAGRGRHRSGVASEPDGPAADGAASIHFRVRTADGATAIRDGCVHLDVAAQENAP
jgi:acyl dehydratase